MRKYSQQEKEEALRFFEENFTVKQISEVLAIPEGTLYRWKSEGSSKKIEKSEGSSKKIETLNRSSPAPEVPDLAELKQQVALLTEELLATKSKLDEVYTWATKKIRAEERRRELDEAENPGGFRFNRK